MKSRIVRPTNTWAPCSPVRQKKIVAKALSRGAKPIRAYSVDLGARNVKPMRNVSTSPAWRPARLPRLIEVQRPVHREARRDQDRGVDPRDEDGKVERRPAASGGVVDDPDEEVGREERAEQHDLRADEEEHPEHARVDPRAGVRDRRAVVLDARARRARSASTPAGSVGDSTCSTGSSSSSASARRVAAQPARLLAGEGRDDDLVDPLVVDGMQRRGVRVGVRDLAVRVDALSAQRSDDAAQPPLASGCSACAGRSAAQTIRKLARREPRTGANSHRAAASRAPSRSR